MQQNLYENYLSTHLGLSQNLDLTAGEKFYLLENLRHSLPKEKGSRILDIGCGSGKFLTLLRGLGYGNISGVEAGKEQVDYCRQLGLDVIKGDALDFIRKHEKVDAVVMLDVIEHFDKAMVMQVLAAVYGSLKEGGVLIIKTPNVMNPVLGIGMRYNDFTHEVGFTEMSIRQVLMSAGFRNVRVAAEKIASNRVKKMVAALSYGLFNTLFRICFIMLGRHASIIAARNLVVRCEK